MTENALKRLIGKHITVWTHHVPFSGTLTGVGINVITLRCFTGADGVPGAGVPLHDTVVDLNTITAFRHDVEETP